MNGTANEVDIARQLLELYRVAKSLTSEAIKNFKVYDSQLYGMTQVYSFDYKNRHYYISNDYSLMDNPQFIRSVLEEINPDLKGAPLRNPVPQDDGAKYASALNGREYYLWEVPSS